MSGAEPFELAGDPPVRGFLHRPVNPSGDALVLTHGAGANCSSPLLIAMGEAFSAGGFTVLRCDLPFRQKRPHGPPHPDSAEEDRRGLRAAVEAVRTQSRGRIFLGGHSYGGRQASMLVADEPELVAGLLLLSYPLHPPKKPQQLRTAHFPQLHTPALFVHGARDGFGTPAEVEEAIRLIPAATRLLPVSSAGHELAAKGKASELAELVLREFRAFFA